MSASWKSSRFTAYTHGPDGALLVYNSASGAIGSVPPEYDDEVRRAVARGAVTQGPLEGILADLAQGGFLVPAQTDEAAVLQSLIDDRLQGGRTLHLILLPTEGCNFRCVYCYEHFKRHEMLPEVQEGLVRWVEANAHRYDHLYVEWFGGEPLCAAEVVLSLGRRLMEVARLHGLTYTSGMSTNGYDLTPELAERLLAIQCTSFSITLDGVQAVHDRRRVLADGSGTFDTIIQNLLALKQTDWNFAIRLRHNFDPESLPRAEEFLALLAAQFGGDPRFSDISMRQISRWGGPNDSQIEVCDARDGMRARYALLDRALGYGFHEHAMKLHLQPRGFVCYASDPNSLIIGADGKVMKCTLELDTRERNIVGRLHSDGRLQLDAEKMAAWVMSGSDDSHCRACFMAPSCQGAACAKTRFDLKIRPCPDDKRHIAQALRLIYQSELLGEADSEEVVAR